MPAAQALAGTLDPTIDDVVWVDRGGLGWPLDQPGASEVHVAPQSSRGTCYALGLSAARSCLVAFTDSETVVDPLWRRAAVRTLQGGAGVVGGPVLPSGGRSATWAGFLVDYGLHAIPPYTSATGDIAGNNVAYRRDMLPDAVSELWKSQWNARLRARGITPVIASEMRVTTTRAYSWSDLGPGRLQGGVLYGSQRSRAWPPGKRLGAALGCTALPLLVIARLSWGVRADRRLRRHLVACSPAVVLAVTAWSMGEALAYLGLAKGAGHVW